jgi:hypothetical protein
MLIESAKETHQPDRERVDLASRLSGLGAFGALDAAMPGLAIEVESMDAWGVEGVSDGEGEGVATGQFQITLICLSFNKIARMRPAN